MISRDLRLAGSLLVVLAVAACGSSAPSPSSGSSAAVSAAPGASAGASEAATSAAPETSAPPVAEQTDTEWGRIWDSLPSGFPRYPGSTLSEEAESGPASAVFVVEGGEPSAVATWFQHALETASFSTVALSGPLEDGGYVLDSAGSDPACRLSVTIAPLGGTTSLTIMYGASCPHD